MKPADQKQLIAEALAAQKNAYCKYSNFPVGAAILTASGKVFRGVNVENVSYGLTICAERVAAGAAVAAGEKEFVAVAVTSKGGVTPCGACRQFLAEFLPAAEKDILILMVDSRKPGEITKTKLSKLLPNSFDEKKLKAGQKP